MRYRTLRPSLNNDERVSTALLLAAGTGSRLAPLTDEVPKCLVPVNEITILKRLVDSLQEHNFKRLIIVVGHQADCIRKFLGPFAGGMEIVYVTSPLYKTTNNIYSLWLTRKLINEPFLLIESDLVFDSEMLKDMLTPDRIAIAELSPWMDGTTVTINRHQKIGAFYGGDHQRDDKHFKTVNIYSLSRKTWHLVRERLERQISANMMNGYYETVFADMANEGCLSFSPVFFDPKRWYEIDNHADLRAAEKMCARHYQPQVIAAEQMVSRQKSKGSLVYKCLKGLDPFSKVAAPAMAASPLSS
ncbi:MAG: phosphocholine cytidylyltransferase family protein [Proteobacteria bacterium]|nr:phosphocholine cytidylyltransferase family protein [Pseudomonadota bacterium]MBU1687414.1 phosphocholine cytidylyltransferase family protein [Pseudomonadota bacterium]